MKTRLSSWDHMTSHWCNLPSQFLEASLIQFHLLQVAVVMLKMTTAGSPGGVSPPICRLIMIIKGRHIIDIYCPSI